MSTEHLDLLLANLNNGDAAAAEQVFRTYEPYLRMLVRRELRAALRLKFDSTDVVQSVWADVLEGLQRRKWHFEDRAHLQAFLIRLARNRFLDFCRKHRGALNHETPLKDETPASAIECDLPRPSEVAQRNELWDRILALSPPGHHELLRMKLEGLSLSEIAAQTGLHPGSVRRILVNLARRLSDANERGFPAERFAR
jgi:RNA polymerase sigma-70 factor (ECF subfamily)